MQSFSGMEEQKLDSEGGKQRGSQTIEGEEHWVEYNQCREEFCEIALICVHKKEALPICGLCI